MNKDDAVEALAEAHPDMEGYLADAIRDCFRNVAGKVVSFEQSERMARAALSKTRVDALEEVIERAFLEGYSLPWRNHGASQAWESSESRAALKGADHA